MAEQVYQGPGAARFACAEHNRAVSLTWGAGYPQADPPECEGHPMELIEGDHPQKAAMIEPPAPAEPESEEEADRRLFEAGQAQAERMRRRGERFAVWAAESSDAPDGGVESSDAPDGGVASEPTP